MDCKSGKGCGVAKFSLISELVAPSFMIWNHISRRDGEAAGAVGMAVVEDEEEDEELDILVKLREVEKLEELKELGVAAVLAELEENALALGAVLFDLTLLVGLSPSPVDEEDEDDEEEEEEEEE